MKKLLMTLLLCQSAIFAFSQSNFIIKELGSKYTSEQITVAFNIADFCGYYFKSKNHEIKFDDGTIVFLISENQESNFDYGSDCVVEDTTIFPEATWSISANGIIIRKLSPKSK